ncbi:MAG: hypothetical protein WB592_00560, partial [Acidimicrobiales bacterium]
MFVDRNPATPPALYPVADPSLSATRAVHAELVADWDARRPKLLPEPRRRRRPTPMALLGDLGRAGSVGCIVAG